MKDLKTLRAEYHKQVGLRIVRFIGAGAERCPNFADSSSQSSIVIAQRLARVLGFESIDDRIRGQTTGGRFEELTCEFLKQAFSSLQHLPPGNWEYVASRTAISDFVQYRHLKTLASLIEENRQLAAVLGQSYIVRPDIVIVRRPVTDAEINKFGNVIGDHESIARYTQFRERNQTNSSASGFLHASISCKGTIRSDRAQNARTEALNLIRHCKGSLPHVVAVTAEPLPTRIASLALGTGDLDCVYHFALPELRETCSSIERAQDQLEMLETLVQGERLRDISDLPFDLAV